VFKGSPAADPWFLKKYLNDATKKLARRIQQDIINNKED